MSILFFLNIAAALFLNTPYALNSKAVENTPVSVKVEHAFHISKTEIVFNPTARNLQITLHIFIDDFEKALETQGAPRLFLGTEKEATEANTYIQKYIYGNFLLELNGKSVAYSILGKEITTDKQAMYVYAEVKNVKTLKQLSVQNKLLTEIYADQKNIVQVQVPQKKQGYFLLDRNHIRDSVSW
jgi:hypothetical protein